MAASNTACCTCSSTALRGWIAAAWCSTTFSTTNPCTVRIGAVDSPGCSENVWSSRTFAICPRLNSPRSPPASAFGPPEYCFARSSNLAPAFSFASRSEEHTSELQSLRHLVCRLLLEKQRTEIQSLRNPVSRLLLGKTTMDTDAD